MRDSLSSGLLEMTLSIPKSWSVYKVLYHKPHVRHGIHHHRVILAKQSTGNWRPISGGCTLNSMCLQRWPKYGISTSGGVRRTREYGGRRSLLKQLYCLQQQFGGLPPIAQVRTMHHSTWSALLLTLTFSKSCTLTWPGVQITMPLSTSDLFFSILAPCMVGGCLCMRGSSDGWERQTPISKSVRSVLCVVLNITGSRLN